MNFQEKSINKLEFSLILDKLSEFAILPAVKTQISSLKPSSNINMLEEELTKTQEALRIIQRSMRAPLYMSCDYDKILLLPFFLVRNYMKRLNYMKPLERMLNLLII